MVATLWISLPEHWRLTSVQAGLQVAIAVLCTVGIFVFSRFCWQLSGLRVAKNKPVTLSSLISISTMGEAYDAVFLLRSKIFWPRYWKILSQAVVVTIFSVAAIVSGPIAKTSTRLGEVLVRVDGAPGMLANRGFNSLGYGYVQWNQTATSLNDAGFPLDQLIDFMPNTNLTWVYRPEEWNSTWTMSCNKTDSTPVSLTDVGVCEDVWKEVPAVNAFFPIANFTEHWSSWYGLYTNKTILKDALLILAGFTWPGYNQETGVTLSMSVSVAAVHLHDLLKKNDTTSACLFGKGPVQSASYTMVQCELQRRATIPNEYNAAFPDHGDRSALVDAYIANYISRMARESTSGNPITPVSPDELIRFYQAYLAVKDTYIQQPVTRPISMQLGVVQVSATFVVLMVFLVLTDLLGLINYLWFLVKHWNVVIETPESKLDWAVQSIMEDSEAMSIAAKSPHLRHSVVATPIANASPAEGSDKTQLYFENARYGGHGQEEAIPLRRNRASYSTTQSHASTSGPLSYNISPYDAHFASPDYNTGYNAHGSMEHNVGLGVHVLDNHINRSRPGRGYQRLT